jgi:hypothetical protein
MRGFLVGTLVLVVIEVVLQPGAAGKATSGAGVVLSVIRRALSPGVAGVPARRGNAPTESSAGQSGLGVAGQAGQGAGGGGGHSW